MARMPWLKLYTEIRTDPKMQALTDAEFRVWINFLCLASESKVRGAICIDEGLPYPPEALARTLFINVLELESSLDKFQRLQMVEVNEFGIIEIIHFYDRQYEKPSDKPQAVAQRVQKHRQTKKEGVTHEQHNANVTLMKHQCNATDIDTDIDTDINIDDAIGEQVKENSAMGIQAVRYAEANFGRPLSPTEISSIAAWCDDFSARGSPDPDALVIAGLQRCVLENVRKVSYLKSIMVDWLENGVTTLDHIASRDEAYRAQREQKQSGKFKQTARSRGKPGPDKPDKYDSFYL